MLERGMHCSFRGQDGSKWYRKNAINDRPDDKTIKASKLQFPMETTKSQVASKQENK